MATPNSSLQPQQQAAKHTGKQTAEHYQISAQTLWRWTKLPGFPQPLRRGSIVRYDIIAIDRWLAGEVCKRPAIPSGSSQSSSPIVSTYF